METDVRVDLVFRSNPLADDHERGSVAYIRTHAPPRVDRDPKSPSPRTSESDDVPLRQIGRRGVARRTRRRERRLRPTMRRDDHARGRHAEVVDDLTGHERRHRHDDRGAAGSQPHRSQPERALRGTEVLGVALRREVVHRHDTAPGVAGGQLVERAVEDAILTTEPASGELEPHELRHASWRVDGHDIDAMQLRCAPATVDDHGEVDDRREMGKDGGDGATDPTEDIVLQPSAVDRDTNRHDQDASATGRVGTIAPVDSTALHRRNVPVRSLAVRILMVSRLWPPRAVGGAERYAAGLATALSALGHTVGVVTFGVEAEGVVATVPTQGVEPDRWWEAPPWRRRSVHVFDLWNPVAARVLRGAVRSFRPDVVHSHAVAGLSVAALLTRAPRVHTVHDHWLVCWKGYPMREGAPCRSTCASCVPYAVSRRALVSRRPPIVIAPSRAVRDAHAARGWDVSRWRVIRNPAVPPPVPRSARRAPGEVPVLGYIGQLNRDKGVDLLLALLDDPLAPLRAAVAGSGDLAPEVAVHPRVDYRGIVEGADKERFFGDIDVLVVPSRHEEVAPLVLDEAAARAVPVIASRRGGIPEYVAPSCHALLFDPDRPASLAAAVERFVREPTRYVPQPSVVVGFAEHAEVILDVYREAIAVTGEER